MDGSIQGKGDSVVTDMRAFRYVDGSIQGKGDSVVTDMRAFRYMDGSIQGKGDSVVTDMRAFRYMDGSIQGKVDFEHGESACIQAQPTHLYAARRKVPIFKATNICKNLKQFCHRITIPFTMVFLTEPIFKCCFICVLIKNQIMFFRMFLLAGIRSKDSCFADYFLCLMFFFITQYIVFLTIMYVNSHQLINQVPCSLQ